MALVNWNSNITTDNEVDLVNDTNVQTGSFQVNNNAMWTFSISGATRQSHINPFYVSADYSVTYTGGGGVTCVGSYSLEIRVESNAAMPDTNDWQGWIFADIQASSIMFARFKHMERFYFGGTYTTDNLTLTKVEFSNCVTPLYLQVSINCEFGDIEVNDCNCRLSYSGVMMFQTSSNVTLGRVVVDNVFAYSIFTLYGNGTLTLSDYIADRSGSQSNYGHFYKSSGTPHVRITRLWAVLTDHSDKLFNGLGSTSDVQVDGGIVYLRYPIYASCLSINSIITNVDHYGYCVYQFNNTNGPNGEGCYFVGGGDTQRQYDINTPWDVTGGNKDGIADVNTGPFVNWDSILNTRSTPNYPPEFSVSPSAGTPGANGATITFTADQPGKSRILISQTSRTVDHVDQLQQYEMASNWDYEEKFDKSGNGKLFTEDGSRSHVLDFLESGKTHYCRVEVENIYGESYYSDEFSFITTGGGSTLAAPALNSITDDDNGTSVTLNITPPADPNGVYDHCQILYKLRSSEDWTTGDTYAGTAGVAGDVQQTGLSDRQLYEFAVYAVASDSTCSPPSSNAARARPDAGNTFSHEKLYLDNEETLLANCATFHTWIEATGTWAEKVTAARARIYRFSQPEASVAKPFAVIDFQGEVDDEAVAAGNVYLGTAGLYMSFADDVASGDADDPGAVLDTFIDTVGKIKQEMLALAGTDDYLNVTRMSYDLPPVRSKKDGVYDEMECAYLLEVGI